MAKVKKTFIKYEMIASGADNSDSNNLTDEIALFKEIDHRVIRNSLPAIKRNELLVDLSRILISLYEREWHYYLFVPKRRKSNQPNIYWPAHVNRLEDFPTTAQGVRNFQVLDPRAVHIDVPRSDRSITTEGEQSIRKSLVSRLAIVILIHLTFH
jgi:hypothetical protein